MRAVVLSEVPDPNIAAAIAANDLALVWVYDNIVDRTAMIVASLDSPTAGLPDLNGAILRAGHHPFSFTVEGYARDISSVALKGQQGIGVGGLDIVELDSMVARCCEETLVWGYTQAIDLGIRVLNGSGADTRERLPEATRHG